MKLTIEHIKSKLQLALGISHVEEMNNEIVTDPLKRKEIPQLQSSDEDSDEEFNDHELKYQSYPESMRVSSVQEKSFFDNPVQVSSVYPVVDASIPNDKFTHPG